MSRFGEKGYFVKEIAPVYFTLDMDRTAVRFLICFRKLKSHIWHRLPAFRCFTGTRRRE